MDTANTGLWCILLCWVFLNLGGLWYERNVSSVSLNAKREACGRAVGYVRIDDNNFYRCTN